MPAWGTLLVEKHTSCGWVETTYSRDRSSQREVWKDAWQQSITELIDPFEIVVDSTANEVMADKHGDGVYETKLLSGAPDWSTRLAIPRRSVYAPSQAHWTRPGRSSGPS
jgi:hypothetical protein